jgi:hypothetical protein
MVIVKLIDKEYEMPEGWNEVNLSKFEQILEKNRLIAEYKSQILFGLEVFSILIGCPMDDLRNLSKSSFEILTKEIEWVNETPKAEHKEEFIIGGEKFKPLRDLNKMTMGESISLELMIKESNEANLLINILPILLRKVKQVKDEKGNITEELIPFESEKYEERKNLFKENIFITDVIAFKDFF